ncbi:hypothetical protein SUGI_0480320 [Cryptomeria japonica]|nr:hypothetical protein SUGI_0480320 [Cryptomeria japonica]
MAKFSVLCLFFALSLSLACAGAENDLYSNEELTLENGLSWTFYKSSCPKVESIVQKRIKFYLEKDITLAAGLLRLHFHDCFVQGCDASVLLDGPGNEPSEQNATQNLTLRRKAFEIINDIKEHVDKACDVVVSCADITALAARDSVAESGGPKYKVPLGRRDSVEFASEEVTVANIPIPSFDTSELIDAFDAKGLDVIDLVALSGAHTIGIAHCSAFEERLYPT